MSRIIYPRGMYYPRGPLARGLVVAYPMDEGAGAIIHDMSGNGNHGTMAGTYSWAREGVVLSGAGYIALPNISISRLQGTTQLLWVRASDLEATDNVLLNGFVLNGRFDAWQFDFNNGYELRLFSTELSTATSLKAISASDFEGHQKMVGVQYQSGAALRMIIDGAVKYNSDGVTTTGTLPALTDCGRRSDATRYFKGTIIQVLFWERVLTSSELQQLYLDPDAWRRPQDPWELWTGATSIGGAPVSDTAFMTTNTGFWGY